MVNKATQLTACKRCGSPRLIKYKTSLERIFYRCLDCGKLSSRQYEMPGV